MHITLSKLREKMLAETNRDARFTMFSTGIAAQIKQLKNDPKELMVFSDDLHRETPQFLAALTAEAEGRTHGQAGD
jgi:hypothetical protein